jgi:hypothetical protein
MDYIRIDNDSWNDIGTIYGVLECNKSSNSTGVKLILEHSETKEIIHCTVAYHQIEWLEAKDI